MPGNDAAVGRRGDTANHRVPAFPRPRVSIALCLALLSVMSCSAPGQSTDVLFAAASSQLASAKESGAERLVEFEEAQALLSEAEAALENKDRGVRSLIKRASAKARLAEALARQSKAEAEAARLEAELEKASIEAEAARQEREAAESELNQDSSD